MFLIRNRKTKKINNAQTIKVKQGSIRDGIESVSGWEEWFKGNGNDYERVLSDEKLAAMIKEKEIKNDIDYTLRSVGEKFLKVTKMVTSCSAT